jgi:excisionase family DNA binding protein
MPVSTGKIGNRPRNERDPRLPISEPDRQEIERLYADFLRGKARLVGPGGESGVVPDSLYSFLVELTGLLNQGKPVMIVRSQATLTTMQAASLLGVSRQFLVNLLERGEIPFHLVGTHRRIYAEDLLRHKTERDKRRHRAITELAQAEANEGIYFRNPSGADEG